MYEYKGLMGLWSHHDDVSVRHFLKQQWSVFKGLDWRNLWRKFFSRRPTAWGQEKMDQMMQSNAIKNRADTVTRLSFWIPVGVYVLDSGLNDFGNNGPAF